MDELGKVVFLNALIQRKEKLFDNPNKLPWDEKQRIWGEIFDECASVGCIGLVSADHLRKTTWQNLQRRARFRYEKSLTSDYSVKFTKVDKLVLDIIGRENVRDCFINGTESQFNDTEILENCDFKNDGENTTPSSSVFNEYPYSMDDGNHITQENLKESLNSVLLSSALKLEQSSHQKINEEIVEDDHSRFHDIELQGPFDNRNHDLSYVLAKKSKDFTINYRNKTSDIQLFDLKKERVKAKIEKLKAQSAKINAETRLIIAEAVLKELEAKRHNTLAN